MTYEKALRIFKDNCFGCSFKDKYCKDCKTHIAIEALEKQIPKKPYWENGVWHCKSCGLYIFNDEYFCPVCGQAIDWSDGE